jgi:GTP cyclohydrolase IB
LSPHAAADLQSNEITQLLELPCALWVSHSGRMTIRKKTQLSATLQPPKTPTHYAMNAPERIPLPDIQASRDARAIAINRVGVKGIRYPLAIASRDGSTHSSVATVAMYVALPGHAKGTHMSRFLELLESMRDPLAVDALATLMQQMLTRLEADAGYLEIRVPYFLRKRAPVSGVESLMDYDVTFSAEVLDGQGTLGLAVVVPVTSLCPCSKEISAYGAHNQRSHVTIAATLEDAISPEELIELAERQASCELYGLLKRPDEKYVTERAYDNPKFVEDLVRDVAIALDGDDRIASYRVESENFESIHNHSAYARIERDKRTGPAWLLGQSVKRT